MSLKTKSFLVAGSCLFFALVGCQSGVLLEPHQNLTLAKDIRQSMSRDKVLIVMKEPPVSIDYSKDVVEWHYCDSDTWDGSSHKFIAIYFVNDRVASVKAYTADSVSGESYDCVDFVKGGNYSEPDAIREYRLGRL